MQGNIDIDELEKSLDDSVKVISLAHQSNVLGSLQPVKKISEIAHKKGIITVFDIAQSVGHRKIDVKDIDADFVCFSAHKLLKNRCIAIVYLCYIHKIKNDSER